MATLESTRVCPYCAASLPTSRAAQCFDCGADWRTPGRVVWRGSGEPRPGRRPALPLVFLACLFGQGLLAALVGLLIRAPGGLVPMTLLAIPVVAFSLARGETSYAEHLRRLAFIALACAGLLLPALTPVAAAAAFAAAVAYGLVDVFRGGRAGRSAAVPWWLLLFSAALFVALFVGDRPTAVAAVTGAFCLGELVALLATVARWTQPQDSGHQSSRPQS